MSIRVIADMTRVLADLATLNNNIRETDRHFKRLTTSVLGLGAAFLSFKTLGNAMEEAFNFVTQAEALQLSTERMGALRVAATEAGASFADLSRWLNHINIDLGQAALSGDKAQAKFKGFLGLPSREAQIFNRLGLDAKKLADLPVDERIREVAKAVTSLKSSEDQLAASESLLGRNVYGANARQFLEFLRKVRFEGDDLARKAKNFGFSLTDEQVANIKRGKAALADLGSVWSGFKIQLAARFAPVLEDVLNKFIDWIDASGGLPKIMDDFAASFKPVVDMAADFADYIRLGKLEFADWVRLANPKAMLGDIGTSSAAGYGRLLYWLNHKVTGRTSGNVAQFAANLDDVGTEFLHSREEEINRLKAAMAQRAAARTAARNAQDPGKVLERIFGGLSFFSQERLFHRPAFAGNTNPSSRQALLMQSLGLGPQGGGSPGILGRLFDAVQWNNVTEAARRFNAELGKIRPALRDLDKNRVFEEQARLLEHQLATPMEQFLFMVEQLKLLREKGGLSQELHDLALFQEFNKAERAAGLQEVHLAPSARLGSSTAASIISNFEARRSDDPQRRMEAFASQQTEHQRIIRRLVERFMAAWQKEARREGVGAP